MQGIYLDDQMSGYQIYGNLVENCELGFMLGGGRNNNVYNNTYERNSYHYSLLIKYSFRANDNDIEFDDRGLTWQTAWCSPGGNFNQDLDSFNYQQPPWSTAYPWLVNVFSDSPCTPVGNIIQYNYYCNGIIPRLSYCFTNCVIAETFINQTPATAASWQSVLANNTDICS